MPVDFTIPTILVHRGRERIGGISGLKMETRSKWMWSLDTRDCGRQGEKEREVQKCFGGGKKARNGTYKIAFLGGRFMNTTSLTEY